VKRKKKVKDGVKEVKEGQRWPRQHPPRWYNLLLILLTFLKHIINPITQPVKKARKANETK
jgi:hypothetical protein